MFGQLIVRITLWQQFYILSSSSFPQFSKKDFEGILNIEQGYEFIVTSAIVDVDGGRELLKNYMLQKHRNKGCQLLDLQIDRSQSILICLQPTSFDKDFVIKKRVNEKGTPRTITKSATDLQAEGNIVSGFVLSFGPSSVHGRIGKDGSFTGTILFFPGTNNNNNDNKELKICTVAPLENLVNFLKEKKLEDEEVNEIVELQTVRTEKAERLQQPVTSVVSCGDESQRQVNQNLKHYHSVNGNHHRSRRNDAGETEQISSDGTSQSSSSSTTTSTSTELFTEEMPPNTDYKYLSVFFFVDRRVLKSHFNNVEADLALALHSYVELADWTSRSQDFNWDGKPDNIGFRLAEIELGEYKESRESSANNFSSTFRHKKAQEFYEFHANHSDNNQSVNIAIVPLNSPVYLHLPLDDNKKTVYDGCTACHSRKMMQGIINPSPVRYSWRGEALRMIFASLHIMMSALVLTNDDDACVDCTDEDMNVVALGADLWGSCLLEGSLFDSPNIPLNSFVLSECSMKGGKSCLYSKLGSRTLKGGRPCLQTKEEESYCGNGIVEEGEECDCGSLANCIKKKCKCGPRNGVLPCMNLTGSDINLCEELVKCRGFRFLYEMGKKDSSLFLKSIPDLLESRIPSGQISMLLHQGRSKPYYLLSPFFSVTLFMGKLFQSF